MKLTRKNRLIAALIALFSILFTQFAVAAYVCPGWLSSTDQTTILSATNGNTKSMADCNKGDSQQPGLCHAHCQHDKQSIDKAEIPNIASLLAIGFVIALLTLLDVPSQPRTSFSPYLRRITAPPLSIQNCRFLI